jgi:plastocyanin
MTSHDGRSRKAKQEKPNRLKEQKMKLLKFFKPALATTLGIDSCRLVLLLATAVALIGYPKPANAATFNVTVGVAHPLGFRFAPWSITIHPGDQVKWTWLTSGHSTTSGRLGMPDGIWNSGVRHYGATFTHTFNSVGTFPYYCTQGSGGYFPEVGQVIVISATPTPTPPPVTGPPVAITNPATLIASFSATLHGSVDPNGLATSVYFQYGTTTSYGLTTAPQSRTGNTPLNISWGIWGLSASTTYHFRIVTTNSAGTRYGSDRTFTTLPPTGFPIVTTKPATNVATFAATLNGLLDPHGLTTSVYFQCGITTNYGRTTAVQSQTGNTFRNIAANIGGLATNTTYHFRMVATNSVGTRYGSDGTFTTQ